MSVWFVDVGHETTVVRTAGYELRAGIGAATLAPDSPRGDPPAPEELTNAIGAVTDHLEDVIRDRPDAVGADVRVTGAHVEAIAAVEVGGPATLPMALDRDAAEDVFRTLATEPARDRVHNPGLPRALVGSVVGACCIVVAVMRRLALDTITVAIGADVAPAATGADGVGDDSNQHGGRA